MDNTFISIFKYTVSLVENLLAESILVLLLLGLVLFLTGLAVFCIMIITSITTNKVDGIVAGAVMVTKIKHKQRDGQTVEKRKEWLHAVFEYTKANGSKQLVRSSSGGSGTHKYKTGQQVTLIVDDGVHSPGFTARDVNDRSPIYIALFLLLFGFIFMSMSMASTMLTSLTLGVLSITCIAISVIFNIFNKSKSKSPATSKRKSEHIYDLKDMRPVEDFVK